MLLTAYSICLILKAEILMCSRVNQCDDVQIEIMLTGTNRRIEIYSTSLQSRTVGGVVDGACELCYGKVASTVQGVRCVVVYPCCCCGERAYLSHHRDAKTLLIVPCQSQQDWGLNLSTTILRSRRVY